MKLTNDMKKMIRDGLVNDAYTNAELAEIKDGLAKEVMKHPYFRKAVDLFKRYPEYLYPSTALSLCAWSKYDLPEDQRETYLNICRCLDDRFISSGVQYAKGTKEFIVQDHVDELTEKGQAWWDRLVDYCSGKVKLKDDIDTILKGVNTSKQLVDILPEAKKYIPEENQSAIVPIEVINRAKEVINGRAKAV